MRLIETTAELGRSSGRTAIVGEASSPTKTAGFLHPRAVDCGDYREAAGVAAPSVIRADSAVRNWGKRTFLGRAAMSAF
jgi:hypothetical protein